MDICRLESLYSEFVNLPLGHLPSTQRREAIVQEIVNQPLYVMLTDVARAHYYMAPAYLTMFLVHIERYAYAKQSIESVETLAPKMLESLCRLTGNT